MTMQGAKYVLVVRLIIFVPFVASVNLIEVSWFPRPVFVFPAVCLWVWKAFFDVEKLFLLVHIFLRLGSEHRFRSQVRIYRSLYLLRSLRQSGCGRFDNELRDLNSFPTFDLKQE